MESILFIGIVAALCYLAHRNGKREGSRKGFGVGRYRSKKHR